MTRINGIGRQITGRRVGFDKQTGKREYILELECGHEERVSSTLYGRVKNFTRCYSCESQRERPTAA